MKVQIYSANMYIHALVAKYGLDENISMVWLLIINWMNIYSYALVANDKLDENISMVWLLRMDGWVYSWFDW